MNTDNFLQTLTSIALIRAAHDDALGDWGTDVPITVLLSQLGKTVSDRLEDLTHEQLLHIFLAVENGLASDDSRLVAGVSTGFLEALYERAQKVHGRWETVNKYLNKKSRDHLSRWIDWSGNENQHHFLCNVEPKRVTVYSNESGSILWSSDIPSSQDWQKHCPLAFVAHGRLDGTYQYINSQTEETLVVTFFFTSGLDWNIWFDVQNGNITKITEAR